MDYYLSQLNDLMEGAGLANIKYLTEAYGSEYSVVSATIRGILAGIVVPRVNNFCMFDGVVADTARMMQADLVIARDGENRTVVRILSSLCSEDDGMKRVPEIEMYIDADRRTKVYTNGRRTVVHIRNTERSLWLRVLSAFARLCPWVFENSPVNENDTAFLKCMSEYKSAHAFYEAVDGICKKYLETSKLHRMRVENAADALLKKGKQQLADSYRRDITTYRERIESYQEEIRQYINRVKEKTDKLNLLLSKNVDAEKEEFIDILSSESIKITSFDNDRIRFVVFSTLSCYDEGEVDSYVINHEDVLRGYSSWCAPYELDNMPYTQAEMSAFYKAVFVDHKFDIKLAAEYILYNGANVDAARNSSQIDNDHINNPNIGYAGCLGGYHHDLNEAAEKEDYFAAVAICQQSASSVNLGEIWPMGKVTQDLVQSKGKVIRTADGDITFAEAMKIIKEGR